jgi:DNA polymerase-1
MVISGPLVLIDAMNAFLRNYVRSPYMDFNGERMGGATGMIVSVRKIISDFRASNCLVVWDGEGGSQRRKSIYKEYKAGRTVRLNRHADDMELDAAAQLENFKKQISYCKEYLTMLGVPQVRADGVEADDLIAYIAGKMDHASGCVIVSTDQDMLQLVRAGGIPDDVECLTRQATGAHEMDHWICVSCGHPALSEVKVFSPIKKILYDRPRFISDYGVLPENFRLVKALTGDKSDNIEGIKGFGDRTIVKSFPELAERYVTPHEIMEWAGALKGVLGKRLVDGKARFEENLTLMDLSEPMLSATAARQARDALSLDLSCREVDFRVRTIRDAVSFKGDNFVGVFREFVMRRRRSMTTPHRSPTES